MFVVLSGPHVRLVGKHVGKLPGRLPNPRQHAFVGKLPETDAANAEIAHKSVAPATLKAPVLLAGGKFGLLGRSRFD